MFRSRTSQKIVAPTAVSRSVRDRERSESRAVTPLRRATAPPRRGRALAEDLLLGHRPVAGRQDPIVEIQITAIGAHWLRRTRARSRRVRATRSCASEGPAGRHRLTRSTTTARRSDAHFNSIQPLSFISGHLGVITHGHVHLPVVTSSRTMVASCSANSRVESARSRSWPPHHVLSTIIATSRTISFVVTHALDHIPRRRGMLSCAALYAVSRQLASFQPPRCAWT